MSISWETFQLGEICTMKYGTMPKKSDLLSDGYPVFTGYHIAGYHKEYMFREPQIIVVARGVGGAGDIKMSPAFAFITNISIALKVNDSLVDKKYLYYRLSSTTLRELRTGAAQPQIIIADLIKYKVNLPSLRIQRKIADVLSAYDDLIEVNTHRIRILEQMAQAVYHEWFGKVDVKSLPEGWQVVKLGDVARVNSGNIGKGNDPQEINYVDISSVSTGRIENIELMEFAIAPSRARRIVQHGDIIWSSVRPNRKSYSLIINPVKNMIVSTGFAVLHAERVPFAYLYQTVTTNEFVDYLTNRATGAAYPAVSAGDFENAEIILPSKDLLQEFGNFANPMFLLQHNLLEKNANLRRTRDQLLPRLVTGEVRVD